MRSVGDLIKGLPVNEAEAQLLAQTRRPSKALLKLLRSAVANAKNNTVHDVQHLFVSSVRVDGGPMLKRMLPRARGSASPIGSPGVATNGPPAIGAEIRPVFVSAEIAGSLNSAGRPASGKAGSTTS